MGLFSRWRNRAARPTRRAQELRPSIDALESREMPVVYSLTGTARPRLLQPTDGQTIVVRLKGQITNNLTEKPSASYQVLDQYRRNMAAGPISLTQIFVSPKKDSFIYSYDFKIPLQAQVHSGTGQGRAYYILISAGDRENGQGKYFAVLAPISHIKPLKKK